LEIAAGGFSEANDALEPDGWVVVEGGRNLNNLFASYVSGHSMEPVIPHGSLCLFRRGTIGGSRKNRILLVHDRRIVDPETGGSFTLKRYHRITPVAEDESREDVEIHLEPDNLKYEPIVLKGVVEGNVAVAGEFLRVIG
jgi:hypothetical protein